MSHFKARFPQTQLEPLLSSMKVLTKSILSSILRSGSRWLCGSFRNPASPLTSLSSFGSEECRRLFTLAWWGVLHLQASFFTTLHQQFELKLNQLYHAFDELSMESHFRGKDNVGANEQTFASLVEWYKAICQRPFQAEVVNFWE